MIFCTYLAMASEDVSPGDSIPMRFMKLSYPRSCSFLIMKSCDGSPGAWIFGRIPEKSSVRASSGRFRYVLIWARNVFLLSTFLL